MGRNFYLYYFFAYCFYIMYLCSFILPWSDDGWSIFHETQHPSSGPTGRGPLGNRMTSGALANESAETSFSPLIGRVVRTRWPDDNNFYEAKITDFNPVEVI